MGWGQNKNKECYKSSSFSRNIIFSIVRSSVRYNCLLCDSGRTGQKRSRQYFRMHHNAIQYNSIVNSGQFDRALTDPIFSLRLVLFDFSLLGMLTTTLASSLKRADDGILMEYLVNPPGISWYRPQAFSSPARSPYQTLAATNTR